MGPALSVASWEDRPPKLYTRLSQQVHRDGERAVPRADGVREGRRPRRHPGHQPRSLQHEHPLVRMRAPFDRFPVQNFAERIVHLCLCPIDAGAGTGSGSCGAGGRTSRSARSSRPAATSTSSPSPGSAASTHLLAPRHCRHPPQGRRPLPLPGAGQGGPRRLRYA
jgi:hypothetical protein